MKENCEAYLEERASGNHLRYTAPLVNLARILWYNRQRLSRMTLYLLRGADRCSWERLAYPGAPDKSVVAPRADKMEIVNGGFD